MVEKNNLPPGLTRVAQAATVTEVPTEPTYYVGQQFNLEFDEPLTVPIGLISQMSELRGEYREKVYFRGQLVTVKPKSVLQQGLDVFCQLVQNQGEIGGEGVTGTYQQMQ